MAYVMSPDLTRKSMFNIYSYTYKPIEQRRIVSKHTHSSHIVVFFIVSIIRCVWNYLSIPKLERYNRWILGIDK